MDKELEQRIERAKIYLIEALHFGFYTDYEVAIYAALNCLLGKEKRSIEEEKIDLFFK